MARAGSMMKSNKNKTSVQRFLIILLIVAVILAGGLVFISYYFKISQQKESAQALSAAKVGLEKALESNPTEEISINIGQITVKVKPQEQGGKRLFDFGGLKFVSDELPNVWLIGHTAQGELNPSESFPSNGKITICWGDSSQVGAATPPTLEVSLIYKDGANYKVIRAGFDPKAGRTVGFEGADDSGGGNCGNLAFAKNIDLASGTFTLPQKAVPYLLRLKLLYNSEAQPLAVSADNNLPNQGKCFDSTATITESKITRKIRQCQFFEAPPALFDYVLFSGGSLTK